MAQQTSLGGGRMYLFHKQGNDKLIITAHGGRPDKDDRFDWPAPGMSKNCLIWFCSSHGKSTTVQVADILLYLHPKMKQSGTAFRKMQRVGFHPYPIGKIINYELAKFTGYHGGGTETYEDYKGWVDNYGCDIVSPRNRWFSKEIRLLDIFKQKVIQEKGYTNVYCSFCRS
ncbi:MAG: hypothetical protein FJ290_17955 [Planctomycetes bacterium]|nr:hypothetical protein [Planctomycetota bacterium]